MSISINQYRPFLFIWLDLIVLYGELGLPYIEMTDEDCELELETVDYLKGMIQ